MKTSMNEILKVFSNKTSEYINDGYTIVGCSGSYDDVSCVRLKKDGAKNEVKIYLDKPASRFSPGHIRVRVQEGYRNIETIEYYRAQAGWFNKPEIIYDAEECDIIAQKRATREARKKYADSLRTIELHEAKYRNIGFKLVARYINEYNLKNKRYFCGTRGLYTPDDIVDLRVFKHIYKKDNGTTYGRYEVIYRLKKCRNVDSLRFNGAGYFVPHR